MGPITHELNRLTNTTWSNPEQINRFIVDGLKPEEHERYKEYIKLLATDTTLELTEFEMKRIAVAMIALDRGDKWFFNKSDDNGFDELKIELQKFLHNKEAMIIETLRKARERTKPKPKTLWDQIDDPSIKNIEVKIDGSVEGVPYTFEVKKKNKPKFGTVTEKEAEQVKE